MVYRRGGRGQPVHRKTRYIKDTVITFGMKVHEAGELARNQESFRHPIVRTIFCKGPVT